MAGMTHVLSKTILKGTADVEPEVICANDAPCPMCRGTLAGMKLAFIGSGMNPSLLYLSYLTKIFTLKWYSSGLLGHANMPGQQIQGA